MTRPNVTLSSDAESAVADHRSAQAEQIRLLYRNARIGIGVNVANSSIVGVVLWSQAPHALLAAWVVTHLLLAAARTVLVQVYHRTPAPELEPHRWGILFCVGVACAGTAWGATGFTSTSVRLKMLRCHVAQDNYGAGLSSSSYPKRLPVDHFALPDTSVVDVISTPPVRYLQIRCNTRSFLGLGSVCRKEWRRHCAGRRTSPVRPWLTHDASSLGDKASYRLRTKVQLTL